MKHWCDSCKNSVTITVLRPSTIGHPDQFVHVEFLGEKHRYNQEYPIEDMERWRLGQTFCGLIIIFNLYPAPCKDMNVKTIPKECPRFLEFMVLNDDE